MCNKYNGYTNYQTWAIALWIDNDQETQEYARKLVENYTNDYRAADTLKDWVEECNPLADTNSMFSDIMTNALAWVDWVEIVKHFRDE